MATHTLNDEEYQMLIRGRQMALEQAAILEQQLVKAKADDPMNRIVPLNMLARAELKIVCFAVANLPPETIKGWPIDALEAIADLLSALIDHGANDVELAMELRAFKTECESCALERAARREEKIAAGARLNEPTIDTRQIAQNYGTTSTEPPKLEAKKEWSPDERTDPSEI